MTAETAEITYITWTQAQQTYLNGLSVNSNPAVGSINVAAIFSKAKLEEVLADADGMLFYLCRWQPSLTLAFGPNNYSIIGFGYDEADGVKTIRGDKSVFEDCPRPPCGTSGSREGDDSNTLNVPLETAQTTYLKGLSTIAANNPPEMDAGSLNVEVSFTSGEIMDILNTPDCAGIELWLCRRDPDTAFAFGPGNYSMIGFGYKFATPTQKQILGDKSIFDQNPNSPYGSI